MDESRSVCKPSENLPVLNGPGARCLEQRTRCRSWVSTLPSTIKHSEHLPKNSKLRSGRKLLNAYLGPGEKECYNQEKPKPLYRRSIGAALPQLGGDVNNNLSDLRQPQPARKVHNYSPISIARPLTTLDEICTLHDTSPHHTSLAHASRTAAT